MTLKVSTSLTLFNKLQTTPLKKAYVKYKELNINKVINRHSKFYGNDR